MLHAEVGFTPWRPVTLKGVLYVTDSFHPYASGDPKIFNAGTRRGVIPEIVAVYKFGESVVGEFRYEMLAPGDFYTGRSTGQFFRFEINYSWTHAW
jgi:hypothetical protein